MKILFLHTRRELGPKESSWFTLHHIGKALERRGHTLLRYSSDYGLTDERGRTIKDSVWLEADALIATYRGALGPLTIARTRNIPSFLELNIPCPEVAYPFMQKELERLKLPLSELAREPRSFDNDLYTLPTALFGAGNKGYTEKTYRDFGIDTMHMFRAGIDTDLFVPDFEKRKGKVRFTMTAAILNFRKGMYHALNAWASLPIEYHQRVELHVFGTIPPGIMQKLLESVSHDCGNVVYHGYISNSEPEYIAQHAISDVMLCPTFAEGQSGTALEGASFGLYPIVSPYTGIDFGNFPSHVLSPDPSIWIEELRGAIIRAVDGIHDIRASGASIRKIAEERYRFEDFGEAVADFIEKTA